MEARAIQYAVRQSARKMRLVIDLIRGRAVPEADAILRFSKKRAARQNPPFDADTLRVSYAIVNEGQTLKRFTAAAMGRGTPILKRTSHVEIRVAGVEGPIAPAPAAKPGGVKAEAKAEQKPRAKAKKKAPAKKKKSTKKASK